MEVYLSGTGCRVTGLGTLAYYDDKIWLAATSMTYHVAREGTAVSKNKPYITGISRRFRTRATPGFHQTYSK